MQKQNEKNHANTNKTVLNRNVAIVPKLPVFAPLLNKQPSNVVSSFNSYTNNNTNNNSQSQKAKSVISKIKQKSTTEKIIDKLKNIEFKFDNLVDSINKRLNALEEGKIHFKK